EVVPQAERVADLVERHADEDLLADDLVDLLAAELPASLRRVELEGEADDLAIDHVLFEHAVVLALEHLDLATLLDLLRRDQVEEGALARVGDRLLVVHVGIDLRRKERSELGGEEPLVHAVL